jgi:hypothetical protein
MMETEDMTRRSRAAIEAKAREARKVAIGRLTLLFNQCRDFMGDEFAELWLASRWDEVAPVIASAHAAFGIEPDPEDAAAIEADRLGRELADAQETIDLLRHTLRQIAEGRGNASVLAQRAIGEIHAVRVGDVLDGQLLKDVDGAPAGVAVQ